MSRKAATMALLFLSVAVVAAPRKPQARPNDCVHAIV